ncbi:plasmid replication initiator TrfA [Paraburkholderia phenoliruptrix]|uniref:plasmid replication initiator TrfA n=1 Tax=Paraburkholderia phenoliruptrix TaxID=252970 RepID=UPI0034CE033F
MARTALQIVKDLEREHTEAGQLPLKLTPGWSPDKRGMSKSLARSALFAVRDKRLPRERYDNAVMASLDGIEIRYSGEELRQDDHDVFMQLCHLARDEHIGEEVHITGAQALDGLKWGRSDEDYTRLRSCYKRMLEGTVYVTLTSGKSNTRLFGSHLFQYVTADVDNSANIDSTAARWTIKLNAELANIINGNQMTLIKWAADKKMTPLAKWLHRFYATHDRDKTFDYKAETLHRLCGSKMSNMATWRQNLKRALEELVSAGFIKSYTIGPKPSYMVHVVARTLAEIDAAESN